MATIIHINKDGVSTKLIEGDSSFPIIIMNPSSGYVSIDNYTIEWIGNNFKYTNGYIMPTSGTITGLSLRLIDTPLNQDSCRLKYFY